MSQALMLLFLFVGGALSISFLCSILEATLLSSRITDLTTRAEAGERGAAILLDLKQDRIDDAIGAILTLNTIAHTIGATLAGAQAAIVFGDAWVGAFSGVLTLLVLVFTEIIPKTLGTVHASRLSGAVGRITHALTRVLLPVLAATRYLTSMVAREPRQRVSRAEVSAFVVMARRDGTLGSIETRLFQNVLRLREVTVADVMTPRTVAMMLPASLPARSLASQRGTSAFSRIPLYGRNRDDVTGYVLLREVLHALATDPAACDDNAERAGDKPLAHFARRASFLPETTHLGAALSQFLTQREHLAVVADEFGAVAGLVSLEDIVETVLGAEIMDESDEVPDMRTLAARLRDERMARNKAMWPDEDSEVADPDASP